jgi:hypothetical protein
MSDFPERELIRRLEALGAVQPSPEVTRRAVERVRSALAKNDIVENDVIKLPQRIRFPVRRLAAVAAVMLTAVGLSVWLWGPGAGQARADFAEVVGAMKAKTNVSCRQITRTQGQRAEVGWLRMHNDQSRVERSDGRSAVQVNPYQDVKSLPSDVPARALPAKAMDGKGVVGFEVQNFTVWADAESHLPVLIKSETTDDLGNAVICILDDFTFDEELEAEFPPATPVGGVGGPKVNGLVVTPLVGMGAVKFGMSREEVEKLLGQPDADKEVNGKTPVSSYAALSYASRGFALLVNQKEGVESITCFAQPAGNSTKVRDFGGQTDKAIALGASAADIIQVYGEPSSKKQTAQGLTLLRYDELQVRFTLSRNDWLVEISVFHQ